MTKGIAILLLMVSVLLLKQNTVTASQRTNPLVINTWWFINATKRAWQVVSDDNGSALDAIELGCTSCEMDQCGGSVGYGGSPDENGETTLDAMIMDGPTHRAGAVAGLKRIKNAIGVARKVMEHTEHTLLVGDSATRFAIQMGFQEESLGTNKSISMWHEWKNNESCQPNYWRNVFPDPKRSCGPYRPLQSRQIPGPDIKSSSAILAHDTIGMVVLDSSGNLACGTSTNGARHKIPGRVGDAPIAGSGSYVDQEVGAAAATGDGDILMRFLPSLITVENMRNGMDPSPAALNALERISRYYPVFEGGIVAVNVKGEYGAACLGFPMYNYSIQTGDMASPQVYIVPCGQHHSGCGQVTVNVMILLVACAIAVF